MRLIKKFIEPKTRENKKKSSMSNPNKWNWKWKLIKKLIELKTRENKKKR